MRQWFQVPRRSDAEPLTEDEARRRRREAVIILVMGLLFIALAVFETRLPQLSNSSSQSSSVAFFVLTNVNLILLLLLIFLVSRNLAKLITDRRHRIPGARLRTRLVLAFSVLTLFPTVSLFLVAQGFLTAAIDTWFGNRVQRSLSAAQQIAETYYREAGNASVHAAREIGRQLQSRGLLASNDSVALGQFLQNRRAELNLGAIEVFVGDQLIGSAMPHELRAQLPPLGADLRAALVDGVTFLRTDRAAAGQTHRDVIRAGVPIRSAAGAIAGAVVVDTVVPSGLSHEAQRAVRLNQEYRQLKVLERPIRNGYLLTFLLITLVVVFSATWLGFYMARGITVPIQKLGEGMQQVARGNWEYRAAQVGDEEIGTLVKSFNQMTADLQRIHSALEERHQYIENVLANIAAGVVSVGAEGVITTVNRAAAGMLGLKIEEALGRKWDDVFLGPGLRKIGEVIESAREGQEGNIERQVNLAGGRVETVLITATRLHDESGGRGDVILFLEDVSHLMRVERMEAWREVARRITHEIKNPLTPIQLSAQRLRKRYEALLGGPEGELLDECTRTIIGQVDELKRLVNEFSTFARLPAVRVTPHDLNGIVDEALVLFREGHGEIDFVFQPDPSLPTLDLDRDAVKRAILNMLDNAVSACQNVPAGEARIEVTTSYQPLANVVRLEVADNGCGMPAAVKARAFDPYFSTKKDGSGLGLAIVSAVVADHQAYVRIRDNQPRGTRLVIEFPCRRHAPMRVAAQA